MNERLRPGAGAREGRGQEGARAGASLADRGHPACEEGCRPAWSGQIQAPRTALALITMRNLSVGLASMSSSKESLKNIKMARPETFFPGLERGWGGGGVRQILIFLRSFLVPECFEVH